MAPVVTASKKVIGQNTKNGLCIVSSKTARCGKTHDGRKYTRVVGSTNAERPGRSSATENENKKSRNLRGAAIHGNALVDCDQRAYTHPFPPPPSRPPQKDVAYIQSTHALPPYRKSIHEQHSHDKRDTQRGSRCSSLD